MAETTVRSLVVELTARADKAEAAFRSIETRVASFERSVNTTTAKAQNAFQALALGVGKVQTALSLIGAAAGLGGLVSLTKQAIDSASAIHDQAIQLGISSDALQELQFAAKQSGASVEEFNSSMVIFEKNLGKAASGTKQQADLFRRLGLDAKALAGDPAAALTTIADKLAGIQNQAQLAEIGTGLFGRGFAKILPVLKEGGANLEALRQKAHDTGNVLGGELVNAADDLGDRFDIASGAIKKQFTAALIELGPIIVAFIEHIAKAAKGLSDLAAAAKDLFSTSEFERVTQLRGEIQALDKQVEHLREQMAKGSIFSTTGQGRIDQILKERAEKFKEMEAVTGHLTEATVKLGETSAKTGSDIETKLLPPVSKTKDKLAEARQEMTAQIVIMNAQADVLDQVIAGQLAYSDAVAKMAAIEKGAKAQSDALTQAHEKAQRRLTQNEETIKETTEAYDELNKKLDAYNKALKETETSLTAQIKGQQTYLDTLKQAIANGADYETALRDAAKATELATFWTEEYNKALATPGYDDAAARREADRLTVLKAKLIEVTQATEDFKEQAEESFLHLGDLIQEGIRGLAAGTLDISDFLAQQGQAAAVAFGKAFILGKHQSLDIPFIGNISNLVGPNGLIGALFGQGGASAAASFVTNFGQGFSNLAGSIQNTINANQVIWQTAGTTSGHSFLSSFGSSILGGIDQFLGTNLTGFATSFGQSFGGLAGPIAASMFLGQMTASLVGGGTGARIGGIFGIGGALIGGLFDSLFAHTPTKGTQIRKGVEEWLEDLGVTFRDLIDSDRYNFPETKALAKRLGISFLDASKQVLKEHVGPELAASLEALGAFIAGDEAKKLGKHVEQAAVSTGALFDELRQNGGGTAAVWAGINEVIEKAGITLVDITDKLEAFFRAGDISAEFYKEAVLGAVGIFSQDLPEAINVSALALSSFLEDGTFDLEAFQKKTQDALDTFEVISEQFRDAILNSEDGEDAARAFGEGLKKGLAELAVEKVITDFINERLFEGIDLSDGISQTEIDTLKDRVRTFRTEIDGLIDTLREAEGETDDLGDSTTDLGDDFDDTASRAQELTDKIITLNQQLRDLAQQRVDIRMNLLQNQADIGVISQGAALSQQILTGASQINALLGSAVSPIGTRQARLDFSKPSIANPDLTGLSGAALEELGPRLDALAGQVVQEFQGWESAIRQNLQTTIQSINTETQARIEGLNAASQAAQDAIHAEYEGRRQGIQDTINLLEEEKSRQQEITQARIDALQEELQLAQEFQQLAESLQDQIRGLITSSSPFTGTEQLALLQLQASDVRRQIAGASPEDRPDLIQNLSQILGQQLQVGKTLPGFEQFFESVVRELEALQREAAGEGSKAEQLQQRIAAATDEMNVALASIDTQIQAQQNLLNDLSQQETEAINAVQRETAIAIENEQRNAATKIATATAEAEAEITRLRDITNANLLRIYDLQDAVLRERLQRANEEKVEAQRQLNALEHNTSFLEQIAADNRANYGVMASLEAGIINLNAFLASIPKLQGGGFISQDQLAWLHRGETVVPATARAVSQAGGGGAVSIALSPTFAVTMQGSADPEADGRRFARGVQQQLIYDVQHGQLGAEIVTRVKRARGG